MKNARPVSRRGAALLLWLLLSAGCLALALFPLRGGSQKFIPVSLRSELTANYNADPRSTPIAAIQLDLIQDVLQNEAGGGTDLPARLATLANALKTPVPTITPLPIPPGKASHTPPPHPLPGITLPSPHATLPLPALTHPFPTRRPTQTSPTPTLNLTPPLPTPRLIPTLLRPGFFP